MLPPIALTRREAQYHLYICTLTTGDPVSPCVLAQDKGTPLCLSRGLAAVDLGPANSPKRNPGSVQTFK